MVVGGSYPGQWLAGGSGALPGIIFPVGGFLLVSIITLSADMLKRE